MAYRQALQRMGLLVPSVMLAVPRHSVMSASWRRSRPSMCAPLPNAWANHPAPQRHPTPPSEVLRHHDSPRHCCVNATGDIDKPSGHPMRHLVSCPRPANLAGRGRPSLAWSPSTPLPTIPRPVHHPAHCSARVDLLSDSGPQHHPPAPGTIATAKTAAPVAKNHPVNALTTTPATHRDGHHHCRSAPPPTGVDPLPPPRRPTWPKHAIWLGTHFRTNRAGAVANRRAATANGLVALCCWHGENDCGAGASVGAG